MSLIPWKSTSAVSPISRMRVSDEMASFQREMNSLMNSFLNRNEFFTSPVFETASYYPRIDICEKENKYLLDAEMPGISESEIEIDFHNNTLTIKGEKKTEKESKDNEYVCIERSRGSFRRDVAFDEEVDQDSIKADLKDGVLHIELSKKEKSKTQYKKIAIKH